MSLMDDCRKRVAAEEKAAGKTASNGRDTGRRHEHKPTIQELVAKQLGAVEFCNHDELMAMDLPPPSWIVKDLVADDGLTFLGGKKKLGKSWLCLQIAQAVATGADCLGRTVTQGKVLYICLEDGRRRLKSRLIKQQAPAGLPIKWITRFPPLDGDGLGLLMDELDEFKPKLTVIDTLAAAKTGKVVENEAGGMADIGNALRSLGQIYRAGILATHHHGKLTGGDPGDDLRGSSAIGAAADVNLGLYREASGHLIRGEARDVGEFTMPLTFDPVNTWCWQLRERKPPGPNPANDVRQAAADQEVLDALRALGPSDASQVAEHMKRSVRHVGDHLRRLASEGVCQAHGEKQSGRGRPRIVYSLFAVVGDPEEDSGHCPFN